MTFRPVRDLHCEFCTIAAGEDQSVEMLSEGESWLAFFPLNPATPGHTLVVPRVHVRDLWEAELELGSELMRAVISIGQTIRRVLRPDGMNLITSASEAAEQTVFHLHLHVVPRWNDDGFGQIWPTGERYRNADLGNVAERIRREFYAGDEGRN